MLRLLLLFSHFILFNAQSASEYDLNILHYNDFHARFVETSPAGTICNPSVNPCIGGFARLATLVRERLASERDSLLLNAGDSFQGTIWYNILRWNVTQEFMNMLPHDAHVLGNHEFDNGIDGVVPYLEHLNSKVVTANIIDDDEPSMHGLYEKSIIVERKGRKIGIIGVIIATTDNLASTGNLKFTDEVETVKEEAEKLNAAGVDIIIVLSHCGLDIDREIALHAGPHVDIIVGGHSHTLLFNGDAPENSGFEPLGPYPVVVEQATRKVLIVQAAAHTQYLGEIKLTFDEGGHLLRWTGNPHYIGNEIVQAPDVLEKINYYLPMIQEKASQKIGSSMVQLSSDCACSECNLGNFICDAFMHGVLNRAPSNSWHYAHFCVVNRGGIRADIDQGVITYESMILSTPFENNVEVFDLKGEHIMKMLEFSVANDPFAGARMLQVAGLHATYNGSLPVNSRVLNVSVRCIECDVPRYEPLELDKYYKVVSQNFLGGGGDGFSLDLGNMLADLNKASLEIGLRMNMSKTKLMTNSIKRRLYIEGIRAVFDGARPIGSRVLNVTIRCIECDVPKYEPLSIEKIYRVVSTDFIGNGGGNYTMISENRKNVVVIGVDYAILQDYISHQSPVFADTNGRITISNPCIV